MSAQAQAAPNPIPVPEEFPVEFAPGEERLFWQQDRMHFPGQVPTLEAELIAEAIGHGATSAFQHYAVPIRAMHARAIHGYTYNAIEPHIAPPDEMEELARRSEERLLPAIANVREAWTERLLPEIEGHLGRMGSIDLKRAPLHVLMAHFEESSEAMLRLWEIHFEVIVPAYIAVSEFDELYRDLFEEDDQFASYRLLQGFPNKTTEMGQELFRLSREAVESPEIAALLERTPAADVPARLADSAEGRRFRAALDRYLDTYGHRAAIWGISHPSFIEDPAPVIETLKDYAGQPDAADPVRELGRLAAEREQAVSDARERLASYPAPVAAQFEAMLTAAQFGLVLTEDHGFYIDFYASDLVRQIVIEIGRRFAAAGAIDRADDVLHLTREELTSAARGLAHLDLRPLVGERSAELDRYREVTPPPALGTPPPGPPPENPVTRWVLKFFGMPTEQAEDPDLVQGASGSAGRVTGTARVVRSLEDAARLAPGEILVAETTAPPWTPLFATAAAVVTDTGGILSHCAVVAREYGIPAVVGTFMATSVIADGDTIEVDGDAGVVRIIR